MQHRGWFFNWCIEGDESKGGDLCTAEPRDVEDTTGDEANACAWHSWDIAAAAHSLCHFAFGVSGWGRSLGGRPLMVELDLVFKSLALVLWNRYNRHTWDVDDTTGDEANACAWRLQEIAAAALSLHNFASSVSGWGRSLGGGPRMVELDSVFKSSALVLWKRYNRHTWDIEDTTGNEANAHARLQEIAAAALSLHNFASGVSGWGGSLAGRLWMVELDSVLKSSALARWSRYNKHTSESRSWSS